MVKSQGQIQKPYEKSIDCRSSSWNLISQDQCDPEHVPTQTVNKIITSQSFVNYLKGTDVGRTT